MLYKWRHTFSFSFTTRVACCHTDVARCRHGNRWLWGPQHATGEVLGKVGESKVRHWLLHPRQVPSGDKALLYYALSARPIVSSPFYTMPCPHDPLWVHPFILCLVRTTHCEFTLLYYALSARPILSSPFYTMPCPHDPLWVHPSILCLVRTTHCEFTLLYYALSARHIVSSPFYTMPCPHDPLWVHPSILCLVRTTHCE